jgi:hypothetical protein
MKFQDRATEIIKSDQFSYFGIIGSVAMFIALLIPQITYIGTKGKSFLLILTSGCDTSAQGAQKDFTL